MPLGFMQWQLYSKIIKQIPDTVTDIILAWRGEPTLHMDLYGMVMVCPVKPAIATNGAFLYRIPLDFVKAINLSIHNKLSLGHLQFLLEKKCKHPPKITASRVTGEIPEGLWTKVKAMGRVDEKRTYLVHSEGGVWGAIKQNGDRFHLKGDRNGLCPRLKSDLVIAWDGSISRCCYVWDTIPGLNAKEMTLEEIWLSPQMLKIRATYPDEICSKCDQWRTGRTL